MRSHLGIALLCCLALLAGCDDGVVRVRTFEADDCPDVRPAMPGDGCDLRHFVRSAGVLNTDGDAVGVAAAGGFVYLADGEGGLLVVEACDPAGMTVLSRVALAEAALDVAVAGAHLFVATGGGGLVVVNVRDRSAPRVVATAPGAGMSRDVVVDANLQRAYVADDVVGLMIYDVSDPAHPFVLGVENTPGEARGVCVQAEAGIAYVADARLGLRIASVESPEDPWLVKAVATPGEANDVAVSGRYAFVADGITGLTVVDIESPVDAAVVGQVDTGSRAVDVAVADSIAFVVDRADGLLLFDVSAVQAPVQIARNAGEGYASALTLDRDYAYVAAGLGGLRVVDVRTPAPPPILSELASVHGRAMSVVASGSVVYGADNERVFVAEWRDGLLEEVGDSWVGATGVNFTWYEGYLYVCAGELGVKILDTVTSPFWPQTVGVIPDTEGAVDVAFADSIAFTVRDDPSSLVAHDLSTQTSHTLPDTRGAKVMAVDVGARFAYFVLGEGKMWVASLDPSSSPQVPRVQDTNGNPTDVHVRGDLLSGETLFVADRFGFTDPATGAGFSAGVEVYDLSDAMAPEFQCVIETSIPPERIGFYGDVMYVAGGRDGLEVFDITDPFAPVPIGSYSREHPVHDAAFVAGAIVLANDAGGLIALPYGCELP